MITAQKELLREIETLPVNFVQEVSDFIGYLKVKRIGSATNDRSGVPPTMHLSETALSQDWNTPDEDAVWANL
jgi:hypothetical protein